LHRKQFESLPSTPSTVQSLDLLIYKFFTIPTQKGALSSFSNSCSFNYIKWSINDVKII